MAEPGEFVEAVSAMLARALAEAAAGYPGSSDTVYFTASYTQVPDAVADANNNFSGIFNIQPWPSYTDAANNLKPGYGVFGPFQSTFPPARAGQDTVTSVGVRTSQGPGFTMPPAGAAGAQLQYDALFLTGAAVLKFAVPYYSRVYSLRYAQQVLEEFQASPLALMGHMPWSEYTDLDDTGSNQPVVTHPLGIPVMVHPDGQGGHVRPILPRGG